MTSTKDLSTFFMVVYLLLLIDKTFSFVPPVTAKTESELDSNLTDKLWHGNKGSNASTVTDVHEFKKTNTEKPIAAKLNNDERIIEEFIVEKSNIEKRDGNLYEKDVSTMKSSDVDENTVEVKQEEVEGVVEKNETLISSKILSNGKINDYKRNESASETGISTEKINAGPNGSNEDAKWKEGVHGILRKNDGILPTTVSSNSKLSTENKREVGLKDQLFANFTEEHRRNKTEEHTEGLQGFSFEEDLVIPSEGSPDTTPVTDTRS